MNLVYFDESGNSGNRLKDEQQPVFVLCALMVEADRWQDIEAELNAARAALFPDSALSPRFEVHGVDLTSPKRSNFFFNQPAQQRLRLYHAWMDIAARRQLKVFYRAIVKQRYARWAETALRSGVQVNPQIPAFVLLAQIINEHLASLNPPSLGIFISDQNQEVVRDIEEAIRLLRLDSSILCLGQVVEKGFFIDSEKSVLLQLCDLCTFSIRKREEEKIGRTLNPTNRKLASLADPLVRRGREAMPDVIAWLQRQYSPERL